MRNVVVFGVYVLLAILAAGAALGEFYAWVGIGDDGSHYLRFCRVERAPKIDLDVRRQVQGNIKLTRLAGRVIALKIIYIFEDWQSEYVLVHSSSL